MVPGTLTTPTQLQLILGELVDCVCNEVTTNGAGPLCWCGLWHGEFVSWDYCGQCSTGVCGMAWVRLTSVFPYELFPQPVIDLRCTRPRAASVELGTIRCMPTADENGNLPDPEAIAEAAYGLVLDADALYRAILCCSASDVAIEMYTPLGPQGNCAGGTWTAFIPLD